MFVALLAFGFGAWLAIGCVGVWYAWKKVQSHRYDIAKQQWRVTLDCGHVYEVAKDFHSMKVCARWCFSCEQINDTRKQLMSFPPPKPA